MKRESVILPSQDALPIKRPDMTIPEFTPPRRLLLGPGPSLVHPRVLRALSSPLLGHLDPVFLSVMNDIQVSLRAVFQTANRFTIAISGTGSAGMEASIVNVVEPGDCVVVGINGVFGSRIASVVERCGGKVIRVEAAWGTCIEPDAIEQALVRSGPVKAVAIVHAETSTGAWQPLEDIGALCRRHEALFIVDAVTSLGGIPVEVDRLGIDVCYSGSQKCLSCPPGLSPFTMNDRALGIMKSRRSQCPSCYLDMGLIDAYWSEGTRAYHHTPPVSMLYALREAGVPASDAAVQRGVAYLLRTQRPDGTWHVKSRAMKIQPYFESGFPHGDDQWISQAAAAWAVMGLAATAPIAGT